MNRRLLSISAGLLLVSASPFSTAHQPFVEGKHYVELPTRQPIRDLKLDCATPPSPPPLASSAATEFPYTCSTKAEGRR